MQVVKNTEESSDVLSFTISNKKGLDTSVLNSIRRVILNEIPTMAFNTETCEEGKDNVTILKNNSVLHNEYLEHRIGLIPLCIDTIDSEDKEEYKYMDYLFVLDVEVGDAETETREVTTEDLQIYKVKNKDNDYSIKDFDLNTFKQKYEKVSDEDTEKIIRPFIFNEDKHYITITKLKKENITGDDKEHLTFMASPTVDIGKTNARYSHISQVAYKYTIDTKKADIERAARLSEDGDEAAKLFDTLDIEKFYKTDKNGKPNSYDFKLETFGFLDNKKTLVKSIDILINKLDTFISNLEEEKLEVKECEDIQSATEIIIPGEDDTLGNLLHKHIVNNYINEENLEDSEVLFCSYTKPHPLTDEINIKIIVNSNINEIFGKATEDIKGILTDIRKAIHKKL